MKAFVDDDKCRGHGVCAALCPQVFTLLDDGYAVAIEEDYPEELHDKVMDALQQCPEHAITVE